MPLSAECGLSQAVRQTTDLGPDDSPAAALATWLVNVSAPGAYTVCYGAAGQSGWDPLDATLSVTAGISGGLAWGVELEANSRVSANQSQAKKSGSWEESWAGASPTWAARCTQHSTCELSAFENGFKPESPRPMSESRGRGGPFQCLVSRKRCHMKFTQKRFAVV